MAVTDAAILKIKEMIVSGELSPGSRLPPEKELSEALGLSRNSLREAVKALEVIRVLDVRRGDGTYVTSLEPRLLLEAMSFVVDLHQDDSVLEALVVRRMLEPQVAALACRTITDERMAAIEELLAGVGADADVESLVAHDLCFHRALADATGNAYLTSLLDSLSSDTVRARVWRGITEDGAVARTIDEHRGILDAVRQRNAELAQALMFVHVSGVEHWLRKAR
ncbi:MULTISPECIES: FadR/GntR family transcriptional regulator [Streptomyces]|uniref:FadR/GntR family transcriptional regulator n=1 Tax=Streptomyces TaxID=1883 RepID=UPI00177E66BE|nr:FadR/GntR family transcriptional regulator [Streptomyces sp. ME02-6978.2a]MDX3358543.1 FadR/GntR family transcriptional regulator [Streptomyces sp. ME02-6978.2a]GHE56186.1 GntR family transcriptional regulator [Streptomyces griseoaurantiacus]